jgi:hypothetical protein
LDTEDASGPTLAGETVADRDSNRLSLDGESELLTTTRGVSSAHERDPRQGGSGDIPNTAHATPFSLAAAGCLLLGQLDDSATPLVALVRAAAKFENGVLVERSDESTSGDTHAA